MKTSNKCVYANKRLTNEYRYKQTVNPMLTPNSFNCQTFGKSGYVTKARRTFEYAMH